MPYSPHQNIALPEQTAVDGPEGSVYGELQKNWGNNCPGDPIWIDSDDAKAMIANDEFRPFTDEEIEARQEDAEDQSDEESVTAVVRTLKAHGGYFPQPAGEGDADIYGTSREKAQELEAQGKVEILRFEGDKGDEEKRDRVRRKARMSKLDGTTNSELWSLASSVRKRVEDDGPDSRSTSDLKAYLVDRWDAYLAVKQ